MPPEWAPHERTLMAWPCRRELWGAELAAAKEQYAGVANAVAAFEPVTMVVAGPADAAEARCGRSPSGVERRGARDRRLLAAGTPGPIFTLDDATGARAAVQFGFNAWGEKLRGLRGRRDVGHAAVPSTSVSPIARSSELILEGGSIGGRRDGPAAHHRAVPPAPERATRSSSREEIEAGAARRVSA